jgi:hypothetical protein
MEMNIQKRGIVEVFDGLGDPGHPVFWYAKEFVEAFHQRCSCILPLEEIAIIAERL